MWIFTFWKDTGERAIKTFAQAAVAVISANTVGILDIDVVAVLSVAALAALVSLLTSVASAPFSAQGTASMLDEVEYQ